MKPTPYVLSNFIELFTHLLFLQLWSQIEFQMADILNLILDNQWCIFTHH